MHGTTNRHSSLSSYAHACKHTHRHMHTRTHTHTHTQAPSQSSWTLIDHWEHIHIKCWQILWARRLAEHGFHNFYCCILQYTTFKTHYGDMSKMHIVNNQCRQECVVFRKGTMDTGQQLDSITEQVQLATRVIHVGRECSVCQLVQLLFS